MATALILLITFAFSCTKTDEFYQENTVSSLRINTTAAEKAFSVWLDDQLLEDSVTNQHMLDAPLVAGEHRMRIAQAGTVNYFVDTTLSFAWTAERPARNFSLIELDPESDPMLFAGFPANIPAPEEGFITLAFLNTDTTLTENKAIDISLYDPSDPSRLLVEMNNIPYGRISDYYRVPVNEFYNGGMLVIRASGTQHVLFDGRPNWMILTFAFYNWSGNTYLFKFSNDAGTEFPYYAALELFSATR